MYLKNQWTYFITRRRFVDSETCLSRTIVSNTNIWFRISVLVRNTPHDVGYRKYKFLFNSTLNINPINEIEDMWVQGFKHIYKKKMHRHKMSIICKLCICWLWNIYRIYFNNKSFVVLMMGGLRAPCQHNFFCSSSKQIILFLCRLLPRFLFVALCLTFYIAWCEVILLCYMLFFI